MSGQASAGEQCEWFSIHILDQKCRSISTVTMPDGSVRGPGDYFKKKEQQYLNWIDNNKSNIAQILKRLTEQEGAALLTFNPKIKLIKNVGNYPEVGPYNYRFAFEPKRSGIDLTLNITLAAPLSFETYNKILNELSDSVIF